MDARKPLYAYFKPSHIILMTVSLVVACATSSCSSGKVVGLIFFETFSFLWTSQVIGNVALATLAGGPYGSWYYFGPRELGDMASVVTE
jgi:hypothetical protein